MEEIKLSKKPKGSISGGEQRDLGKDNPPAHDQVKTNHGKRKHVNGRQTTGNMPNLEIGTLGSLDD